MYPCVSSTCVLLFYGQNCYNIYYLDGTVLLKQLYLIHAAPSQPWSVSLAAVPGSPNQLTATWTPPNTKNGIITAYTVYCNTSATQAYPEQVIGPNIPTIRSVVNGTTLSTIVNIGLNPFTQYNCYVTANTSVGEGPPLQVVNTKTNESGTLSCVTHLADTFMQTHPLQM